MTSKGGRTLKPGCMPNLVAFMHEHGLTLTKLAAAIDRRKSTLMHVIAKGTVTPDILNDVEAVLREAGYDVPETLWVNSAGQDLAATRRRLRSLRDGELIAPLYAASLTSHARKQYQNNSLEDIMEPLSHDAMEHFGLTRNPFLNDVRSSADVFSYPEFERLAETLSDAAKRQDFVAVSAEVGYGKTLLMRRLKADLPRSIQFIEPSYVQKSIIDPGNILDTILYDLAPDDRRTIPAKREGKSRAVRQVLEAMERDGRSAVLLLDEAHLYPRETIRSLKSLHELDKGFSRLIGIILIGQPELADRLANPNVREIQQRCAVIRPRGLGKHAESYLRFKFERAGAPLENVFDANGLKALFRVATWRSGGPFPLFLHTTCSAAMNQAAINGSRRVGESLIAQVARPDIYGQEVV